MTKTTRKIFKLVIFGNLFTGNEERTIECANWKEAVAIKDSLLKGRPYYSLDEAFTITREAEGR